MEKSVCLKNKKIDDKRIDDKRIDEIDIAKGIGIIMTIIGHNVFAGYVKTFIYSFHMPLFFILAGLVMKKKECSTKTLIYEEGKLFRAYFCWSLIYIIFDIVVRIILLEQPIRLLFLDGYQTVVFWGINVLWFIATLAIAKIVAYKLCMILNARKQIIVALILFLAVYIITPLVNIIPKMAMYWCIASLLRAFSVVIFIVIGMNSKEILLKLLNLENMYSLMLAILCFASVALMGNYMGYIDMRVLMLGGNAILFLLSALTSNSLVTVVLRPASSFTVNVKVYLPALVNEYVNFVSVLTSSALISSLPSKESLTSTSLSVRSVLLSESLI